MRLAGFTALHGFPLLMRRELCRTAELHACACRKLNPAILVMQSAQDWATKNLPGAIDGARDRCIFLQGEMRAGPIVIFRVTEQQVTEVALSRGLGPIRILRSLSSQRRESHLARPINRHRIVIGNGAIRVTSADEAIRGVNIAGRMTI
jgi:hypothetical protein